MAPRPPLPRGPLSEALMEHLLQPCHPLPSMPSAVDDPLWGEDSQLALYCCYELHYQSFAGVEDGWEWEPSLLAFRRRLEEAFEGRLRQELGAGAAGGDVVLAVQHAVRQDGPSLSRFMQEVGSLDQLREFAVHRSGYQLKEADPHTWAIPRLRGRPKAALVEIQFDEYGRGIESAMHATLFATTMEALGLDSTYGAYLDLLPGPTLATTNLISLFGLHRRLRGALVGHLAVFESTSVEPMRRYRDTLRRLGVDAQAERFYQVHVEVDAHHQVVAFDELIVGLASVEPALVDDILFGARAVTLVEGRFSRHLLDAWSRDRTSLLQPLPPLVEAGR